MNLVSIVDEDSRLHADSVGASLSSLNDKQEIETVGRNITQGSPDHVILLSSNDGVYIAKLHDKLPHNIMSYLQEYTNKCFKGKVEGGTAERQFKYYQTSSDENAELEMNVFLLAKGLLKRLIQGKDQTKRFALYKAKLIHSKKKLCEVKAPTQFDLPIGRESLSLNIFKIFSKNVCLCVCVCVVCPLQISMGCVVWF